MTISDNLAICVINGYPAPNRHVLADAGMKQAHEMYVDFLKVYVPNAKIVARSVERFFGGSGRGNERIHALGPLDELVVDVFSFRPADYALLGGQWGIEGDADTSAGDPAHRGVAAGGQGADYPGKYVSSVYTAGP